MQGSKDPLAFEDVLSPEALEALIKQPGVAERLLPLLPDGMQTEVCNPSP